MSGSPPGLSVPARIGRYEIQAELGRGMMGVVYKAYDPALARTIALKTIALHFAVAADDRETFVRRFLQEARIAAGLSHPGIVVVHDVGEDQTSGALFIAMEYLSGRTLADVVATGRPFEWREALRVTARVAEALHHAHGQGVVHRDIKPANVMLLDSGAPKIMDFGIAKLETARHKLTSTGQLFGTPLFMSPEQARGEPLDGRSDLFSLGVIAYNLLTGVRPFDGPSVPAILARVLRETPPPPSHVVPGLTPDVDYVVLRALAKFPNDRFPSGQTFAEDLDDVRHGRAPRHRAQWLEAQQEGGTLVAPPTSPGPDLDLDELLRGPGAAGVSAVPDTLAELASLVEAPAPAAPGSAGERVAAAPVTTRPSRAGQAPPRPSRGLTWGAALAAVALGTLAVGLWLSRGPRQATPTADVTRPSAPREPRASAAPASEDLTPRAEARPPSTSDERASEETRAAEGRSAPPASSRAASESAQLVVDFEHPLKAVTLRVWIDGEKALDEDLDSRITKKIAGLKLRKGGLEETLDVRPGRRRVRVQVAWDDNVKTDEVYGTFTAGDERTLEVRIGRLRKNLSVDWK